MSEWQTMKLSEIINIMGGGTPKRSEPIYWNGNIPWLSVSDFNNDFRYVNSTKETITELGLRKSSTQLLSPSQIIISARGTVGCLAQVSVPMAFNQSCYGLEGKDGIVENDFLYYLLKKSIAELRQKTHGAVFDTITRDTFNHLTVSYPPLEKQRKISNILGTLDNKIQLNTQTNQTLEAIAQAIFKHWFIDFAPVHAKAEALAEGKTAEQAELAAMASISGKTEAEITELAQTNPQAYQQLQQTAAAFPSEFVESELGLVPKGWEVKKIEHILFRLKNNQKINKDDITPFDDIPVFEQGQNILMGYHPGLPGFNATPNDPIFIFGDHTCITHISTQPFSIYQNVIPLKGKCLPTFWVFMAIKDRQTFQEYRRHWSELISKDIIVPGDNCLHNYFSDLIKPLFIKSDFLYEQNKHLAKTRDTLLPKLLNGEIEL